MTQQETVKMILEKKAKLATKGSIAKDYVIFDEECFASWLDKNKDSLEIITNSYTQKIGYGSALRQLDNDAFRQEYLDTRSELVDSGEVFETEEGEYCYA